MNVNGTTDTDAGTTTSAPPASPAAGVSVDLMTAGSPSVDFGSLVPSEYKNTEWVQNLSKTEQPVVEMFKKVDNLEKMIGSRPPLPTKESTPEQWETYRKAIGVPEKPDQYTYQPIQYEEADKEVGALLDKYRDGPFFESMKGVFHKAGLTPEQVQSVVQGFEINQILAYRDHIISQNAANETAAEAMQKFGEKYYGDQFNNVCSRGHQLMKECVNPAAMPLLEKLPGEALGIMAMVLEGVRQKYIREDGRVTGTGTYAGGMNQAEILAEMTKVWNNPSHNAPQSAEYEALQNRLTELRAMLERTTK